MARLIGGDGNFQCARIGEPDILAREARHAARDVERILPRFQHAGKPVNRGVRIGIAHGFMERRNKIVMLFPRFIVKEGFFRRALFEIFRRDHRFVADDISV